MPSREDKPAGDAASLAEQRRRVLQHPEHWPPRWSGFEKRWGRPDQAEAIARDLDLELAREISPGHALHGRTAMAIGKKTSTDDVLFAVDGGKELAVVHLTW